MARCAPLRLFWLAVPAVWLVWISTVAADTIQLNGTHLVTLEGDDPTYAKPEWDDSGWTFTTLPGTLREAGLPPKTDIYWYRIKFELPEDWDITTPALQLGIINWSDETFLNGVPVGKTGWVGPRHSDWHTYTSLKPRLYPVPADLFQPGEQNVIAIRVAREPWIDDGGISGGPLAVVDLPDALPAHLSLSQRFLAINYLLFGVETVILLLVIATFWQRPRLRAAQLMLLVFLPYWLNTIERRIMVEHDYPVVQFAANFVGALALPALIALLAHMLGRPIGGWGRLLQVFSLFALTAVPLTGLSWMAWWVMHSPLIWHLVFLIALLTFVCWTAIALWRKQQNAQVLFLGILALAGFFAADIALPAAAVEARFGIRLAELGIMGLFISLSIVVGQRILAIDKDLMQANSDILTAHETERARLARDMHDSIGQWLSTLKLRIQLLGKGQQMGTAETDSAIEEILTDVGHAIADTRRVAHDLSPLFLQELGLEGAIRNTAQRYSEVQGATITVEVNLAAPIPDDPALHIFRIFQEGVSNAARHADAKNISINLQSNRAEITLQIANDGTSLDGKSSGESATGLGMKNMKDRARLLEGDLTLEEGENGSTLCLRCAMPAVGRP